MVSLGTATPAFSQGAVLAGQVTDTQGAAVPDADIRITTEDGSVGMKGLVTRALEARLDTHRGKRVRVMGCGPNAMLWAAARIAREREVPCFISLEENMACGIGVCLGCAIPARSRPYRYVCSNGPVFDAADVLDVKPTSPAPPPPSECPA